MNSGLEEGYFANTLGLYACLGKEEPVLFAVAVEQAAAVYMPAKSQTLSGMESLYLAGSEKKRQEKNIRC